MISDCETYLMLNKSDAVTHIVIGHDMLHVSNLTTRPTIRQSMAARKDTRPTSGCKKEQGVYPSGAPQ